MDDSRRSVTDSRTRLPTALAAVVAMTLPLGTVYAFSIFLRPLERELGATRAELSFVFGLAIIGFTLGMNLAPLLYRLAATWALVAASALMASLGIALAATAPGLGQLAIGYGVLFGLGGGTAYVLLLQGVNLMLQGRRGLVNGFIISLYPLGAMLGAPLFGWSLEAWGLRPTLLGLAATLAGAGTLATWLAWRCGLTAQASGPATAAPQEARGWLFLRLAGVFFLAAAAGLTVLGQAAAIIEAYGGGTALALAATTAITAGVAAARIAGGWLADRFAVPWVMLGAHAVALAADALLLAFPGPWLAASALGLIGIGYGIVSGGSTAAIGAYWGAAQYGRMAGRLYIAWCLAAITLPVLAGRVFDLTGSYVGAVGIAAAGNLLGMVLAATLPRPGHPSG